MQRNSYQYTTMDKLSKLNYPNFANLTDNSITTSSIVAKLYNNTANKTSDEHTGTTLSAINRTWSYGRCGEESSGEKFHFKWKPHGNVDWIRAKGWTIVKLHYKTDSVMEKDRFCRFFIEIKNSVPYSFYFKCSRQPIYLYAKIRNFNLSLSLSFCQNYTIIIILRNIPLSVSVNPRNVHDDESCVSSRAIYWTTCHY